MANGRGGARSGAGRPKGSVNRATKQAKKTLADLAKEYAPEALETLASIMRTGESDAARVTAANSILDRGYGKPVQVMPEGDDDAAGLTITINSAKPVGELLVTRSEG